MLRLDGVRFRYRGGWGLGPNGASGSPFFLMAATTLILPPVRRALLRRPSKSQPLDAAVADLASNRTGDSMPLAEDETRQPIEAASSGDSK